jgi:hypothetical protein
MPEREEIIESLLAFDLSAPLSEEELRMAGLSAAPSMDAVITTAGAPVLQDIEEDKRVPVSDTAVSGGTDEYNKAYAYWTQCQALSALRDFKDGWSAFEELVLSPYVESRRLENDNYRGDDPNKAFSLRLKAQAAEDFVKFIEFSMAEAAAVPRPKAE